MTGRKQSTSRLSTSLTKRCSSSRTTPKLSWPEPDRRAGFWPLSANVSENSATTDQKGAGRSRAEYLNDRYFHFEDFSGARLTVPIRSSLDSRSGATRSNKPAVTPRDAPRPGVGRSSEARLRRRMSSQPSLSVHQATTRADTTAPKLGMSSCQRRATRVHGPVSGRQPRSRVASPTTIRSDRTQRLRSFLDHASIL
jgi:hypothetical protein